MTVTFDGADENGAVTATEAGEVTVTASDGIDPASASATVTFVWGGLTVSATDADPVMPGGSSSAMLTASGQADGATITFASDNEAVTIDGAMASASGAATANVTASYDHDGDGTAEVTSEAIEVSFEWGPLTLTASDPDPVMPGGSSSAMLTVEGAADGAMVAITSDNEAVTISEDGTMASASGPATAMLTATVGDAPPATAEVSFVWGELTLTASDPDPVMPGGSSSSMLTTSGQADGAEVMYKLEEGSEGATLDGATVSASGAATAIVTAWVGEVGSNAVTVMFEQGPLTLEGPAEVAIGPDGGMATVTASGQADGAEVMYALAEGSGGTLDGATVSASSATTATVTASVGDVMSNSVTIAFVPSLGTESTTVMFGDFGETESASVTAYGFPEGANIRFKITGGTGFATADGAGTWTVSTDKAGDVTMVAEDDMGNATAPLTITFVDPSPYLTADPEVADVIIPDGGEVVVTVTATGLGDAINWTVTEVTGTATVNIDTDGATATLTGVDSDDISQTSTATLIASDGTFTTAPATVTFRKMPELQPEMADVEVPQAVVPSGSQTVVAVGFAPGTEITFSVEVVDGLEADVSDDGGDGNVLTLTATGTVTVSVTATGETATGEVTTAAVMVTFTQETPAAPANLVAQDNAGDNGYHVMLSFAHSENHADVSQYRIYRYMMVNTTLDADGNVVVTDEPVMKEVPWAVVDAMDNSEGMSRVVVPVTDGTATHWGVAAEKGQQSSEPTISGKRVFSKESVQAIVQLLGVDPNLIATADELGEMFKPSAEYIKSIIGDRKNVVFAALDPDLSVLIGDGVDVPQNIRTDGHLGPIVSSPITMSEVMAAALDDTAPAMVTDVAADPDTGLITWTVSADDGGMDMVEYRGHAITIPLLTGYKVVAGASPDALAIDVTQLVVETGVLPGGTSSLQVPRLLIDTLIDQGLPAVFVSVVAMDGTNLSGSVPLMVELAPKRKAFVDADGNPVYIVDLKDGNLTVGFEDFIAFTMAYNTSEATSTREEWRVFIQADLNDDTMVDFADFILFFGSYGREAIGPSGKSLIPPLGVNESAEFLLRLGSERVVVGENMFVDVSLANVQALMGYGFVLHYDAEIFEFVEAVPAAEDLLKSAGGETPLFRSLSPEAGQVHIMNAIANGSEVSGDGDIVRLVFRVLRDFEDNARFEIAEGLVFDPSQLANPLTGGVLDIQTTPTEFALLQNFPNPFNPETTIGYELAESADVTLQIYNVVGQVVRTLMAAEPQSVGRYQVRWDGMDDRGVPVSSGIYFYQISAAGKFQDVRKLMLLK